MMLRFTIWKWRGFFTTDRLMIGLAVQICYVIFITTKQRRAVYRLASPIPYTMVTGSDTEKVLECV